jgi:type IV pilus assembly protein PilM
MEILPTSLGTRPRLAVEVRSEGVIAARAEDATALLTAVSRAGFPEGAVVPGLRAGNVVDRSALVSAVRRALEGVSARASDRYVTVVVPDAAMRVLLLDFDQLPSKAVEALPVVRFRLKKLLPFDVEEAVVSYQIMSSAKVGVHVLAAAIPKAVLDEYESVVMQAGYLPGAVLPSTLAALAALDEAETPVLVVNAGPASVTTAIVRGGVLLLHRSVDMNADIDGNAPNAAVTVLPLEDRERSAEVWSRQHLQEGSDRLDVEAAIQTSVVERAELHELAATAASREIAQAVSVAAAYFEDTLQVSPEVLFSAGTLGAERLASTLRESGIEGLRVREIVEAGVLQAGAVTSSVPRGWLAGVRGALKN